MYLNPTGESIRLINVTQVNVLGQFDYSTPLEY
jgi:hypothetical protein